MWQVRKLSLLATWASVSDSFKRGADARGAFAGVLCGAAMLSTAGRVLSEKMNVLQLTFYTAPVSCAMLFPIYLIREVRCPCQPL